MKRNENFWSYRLHKLSTPKDFRTDKQTDGRTDGGSGSTTRPAFAKATQVKEQRGSNQQPTNIKSSTLPLVDYTGSM